jgi:hypothetical protein
VFAGHGNNLKIGYSSIAPILYARNFLEQALAPAINGYTDCRQLLKEVSYPLDDCKLEYCNPFRYDDEVLHTQLRAEK